MKIIHFNHYSHSLLTNNLNQGIFDDWYARTAIYLKKYSDKYEVECWTPEKSFTKERTTIKEGVKFRIFPSSFVLRYGKEISIPMLKALEKEVKKNKVIIHLHEPHNYHSQIISLLFRKYPIVTQHHAGRSPLCNMKRKLVYRLLYPLFLFEEVFERIAFRFIDKFFILTDFEIDYLKRYIPKKRLMKLSMGVDFEIFKSTDKIKARKKLNLPLDKTIFTFVGSLIQRKKVDNILIALSKIRKGYKDFLLLIIGEGEERKKLQKLVRKLGLEENVKFLGYINNYLNPKILPLYFSASDAYISASSWEGASVSMMEALACNLPIISTNVGDTRNMLYKNTGILIRKDDPLALTKGIIHFLKNKSEFKDIKECSKKFDWKNIINEYLKIYMELEKTYYKNKKQNEKNKL